MSNILRQLKSKIVYNGSDESEYEQHIINTWRDYGLLEGLETPEQRICALKMDQLANIMLSDETKYSTDVTTFCFPAIRRILGGLSEFSYKLSPYGDMSNDLINGDVSSTLRRNQLLMELLDVESLFKFFNDNFEVRLQQTKDVYEGLNSIDYEAETLANMCEEYIRIHRRFYKDLHLKRNEDGSIQVSKNPIYS